MESQKKKILKKKPKTKTKTKKLVKKVVNKKSIIKQSVSQKIHITIGDIRDKKRSRRSLINPPQKRPPQSQGLARSSSSTNSTVVHHNYYGVGGLSASEQATQPAQHGGLAPVVAPVAPAVVAPAVLFGQNENQQM